MFPEDIKDILLDSSYNEELGLEPLDESDGDEEENELCK